jgi:6-pyruvoyltetrahydropterin/6-carboxytetrahydropterin synthase
MRNDSTITCTRRIQFCAGHRVYGHENKCAHPHGHNYVAMLTASAEGLDSVGRVIDFSVLKNKVGGWIDQFWDHGFLVWKGDTEIVEFLTKHRHKSYLMPYNPTAENMAKYLLLNVGPKVLLGTGVQLTHVRIWETENCHADACLDKEDENG